MISNLKFYNTVLSSNEIMRITSTGCVGIGTTSPSQKLDIRDPRVIERERQIKERKFKLEKLKNICEADNNNNT